MPRILLCLPPFAFAAILAATGAPGDRFWAADVSPQRRAELAPLRRELEAALAELGPSPAERIAELRASPAQRRRMRELVETWNRRPQNGDGGLIRARQRDELLEHFGLQALPVLLRALDGRAFWERRTAATACQLLVERYGDQARWHLLRAEAPADVIELVGVGPYAERVRAAVPPRRGLPSGRPRRADPWARPGICAAARDFWGRTSRPCHGAPPA
ncbi:MAG: hypothetical protein R3F62_29570 [Planctomycetota bacterium]